MEINQIIIHHSGSLKGQPYASTAHITPQQISRYHKSRWNFPSKFIEDERIRYSGYTVIYDPKTQLFHQSRVIGEETAHTRGMNFSSVGLCIIGNYSKTPIGSPHGTVDELTEQTVQNVAKFVYDLIHGNPRELFVAPNTKLNLSTSRVHPHRFFGNTECYGSGISNNFFRDKLIEYKRKNAIYNFLKSMIFHLIDEKQKREIKRILLGTADTREDPDFIEIIN